MKKKKSSAARNLEADGKTSHNQSEKTSFNPLDDIALRVIVSNILKHRSTREDRAEEQKDSIVKKAIDPRAAHSTRRN